MKILSNAFRAANHIRIANLPPLTTTKELKKILQQNGLKEVENVALLYKRFKATDEALIALGCSSHLESNLSTLNKLDIYGAKLKAQPYTPQEGWDLTSGRRSRGHKGRKEAAERGVWNGDGPNAGIRGLNIERAVTIWGFPGKATVDAVEKFLEAFKISRTKDGEAMIYKFPL
ncbi:hypothetical protein BKA70DRAFT_1214714 [Coprinopsis sp. MPI-PUGE-AT-0042]|nr:hypothetical protein BKA70DRAFT_1214714 [Coprinopsis sp. MPI-PUGE-AT-0042]